MFGVVYSLNCDVISLSETVHHHNKSHQSTNCVHNGFYPLYFKKCTTAAYIIQSTSQLNCNQHGSGYTLYIILIFYTFYWGISVLIRNKTQCNMMHIIVHTLCNTMLRGWYIACPGFCLFPKSMHMPLSMIIDPNTPEACRQLNQGTCSKFPEWYKHILI